MRSIALTALLSVTSCQTALGTLSSSPSPYFSEELQDAVRSIVNDYHLYYRQYSDRHERGVSATLLMGAAHSGKPVGQLVTFYRLFQETTRKTLPESSAILASAAAITGKQPDYIASLYDNYTYGQDEDSRPVVRAILASAAGISGKSPRDMMKLFKEVGDLLPLDPQACAQLASGAALSGKSPRDLADLYRSLNDSKTPWYTNDLVAIFASAAAISGLPGVEILAIDEAIQIAEARSISPYGSARLAYAAAVGLKHSRQEFRPDFRRALEQPIERAPVGPESAERIFDLNWHTGVVR